MASLDISSFISLVVVELLLLLLVLFLLSCFTSTPLVFSHLLRRIFRWTFSTCRFTLYLFANIFVQPGNVHARLSFGPGDRVENFDDGVVFMLRVDEESTRCPLLLFGLLLNDLDGDLDLDLKFNFLCSCFTST